MNSTNDDPLSEIDATGSDDESIVNDEIEETEPDDEYDDEREGEQPDEEDEEEQEDDIEDDDEVESKQEEQEDDSETQFKPQNTPSNVHPMMDSIPIPEPPQISNGDDGDEYYDEDFSYEKFDNEIRHSYIEKYHPEIIQKNQDQIMALTKIMRDDNGVIVDENHRTIPFLTKYEKTRIIGLRIKQLNEGAKPYINLQEVFNTPKFLDNFAIAEKELYAKKLPFIVSRPVTKKQVEYWCLRDLELIH